MPHAEIVGEVSLEGLDGRAENELALRHDRIEGRPEFRRDGVVVGFQVKKRDPHRNSLCRW